MTIKEIFEAAEGGTLNYEQFETATSGKAKFVDLEEGNYVSKRKYEDELAGKDEEIKTLNGNISSRDKDLKALQQQLEEAGTDADKLSAVSGELDNLKAQYDNEVKEYKKQLQDQAYQFAVKEFSSSQKFTSTAAKRDFEHSMISEGLKMKDGVILGADDFVKVYSEANADAFVVEQPPAEAQPPKPSFAAPTQGAEPPKETTNDFMNAFHFAGVRTKTEGMDASGATSNFYQAPQN